MWCQTYHNIFAFLNLNKKYRKFLHILIADSENSNSLMKQKNFQELNILLHKQSATSIPDIPCLDTHTHKKKNSFFLFFVFILEQSGFLKLCLHIKEHFIIFIPRFQDKTILPDVYRFCHKYMNLSSTII